MTLALAWLIQLVFILRNILRYTQVLYRLFGKNPLLDEHSGSFIVQTTGAATLYLDDTPEFHLKKQEYLRHWVQAFKLGWSVLTLTFKVVQYCWRYLIRREHLKRPEKGPLPPKGTNL